MQAVLAEQPTVAPAVPAVVLHFPGEQDFGLIQYLLNPQNAEDCLPPHRYLCRARGTLRLPRRLRLIFAPNDSISDSPQVLAQLPDDAFVALDFEKLSINDAAVDYILHFKRVSKITFEGTEITDVGLAKLKAMSGLQDLDIYGTNVTGMTVKQLVGLKYLWRLRLGCNKLNLACLNDVCQLKYLTVLNLDRVNLSDSDLLKLATMKGLKALEIPNNKKITALGLSYLKNMPSLRRLDLRACSLSPKDIVSLNNSHFNLLMLVPENFSARDLKMIKDGFKRSRTKIAWMSREEAMQPELFRPLK